MTVDLVIQGGTVLDPASNLHGRRDVAISGGRIAAVAPSIPTADAADVLDAHGLLVLPGLVDLHVHVFWGVADLSVPPGPWDLERGATTVVDAGSAGANTFPGFRRYVIEPAPGRILALLNISAMGQIDPFLGELHDVRYLDPERAARVALGAPELIVGFKVRLTESLAGPNGRVALERTVEAGTATGLPVMAHIGDSTITIEEILGLMRPGDIVTHAFTDRVHGIFAGDGSVVDAAREARARGVRFDVGHGAGSFRFRRAEAALADGFAPDTISSDLHRFNHEGPVFDLATTMSKYLHLGLSLEDVVRMATTEPAAVVGRPGRMGTLGVGAEADVAVMRLEEGPVTFTDSWGDTVVGSRRLVPVATVRAGRRVVPSGPVDVGGVARG
jgi:dihydroorotase